MLNLKNALLVLIPAVMWARYRGAEYIIKHYRWVFVILFLLPMSVVFDAYMYIRNWVVFKMNSAPKLHDARVKHVQKQVGVGAGLFISDILVLMLMPSGLNNHRTWAQLNAVQNNRLLSHFLVNFACHNAHFHFGCKYEGQSKITESCQISHKLPSATFWNLAWL